MSDKQSNCKSSAMNSNRCAYKIFSLSENGGA